jgi:alpha-glucosidase (family GH31 glycosyl hydrolase)
LGNYSGIVNDCIYDRYRYIRQLETCFHDISENGGSCFDPLLFHYPEVEESYNDTEATFIVANAIKVTPVLEPSTQKIESFFPKGNWVDLYT